MNFKDLQPLHRLPNFLIPSQGPGQELTFFPVAHPRELEPARLAPHFRAISARWRLPDCKVNQVTGLEPFQHHRPSLFQRHQPACWTLVGSPPLERATFPFPRKRCAPPRIRGFPVILAADRAYPVAALASPARFRIMRRFLAPVKAA